MKLNKLLAIIILFSVSGPVMAYIDPGSGSAIMSAIIGFFVALGIAIKTYWYQIKSFFTRNNGSAAAETEESNSNKESDNDKASKQ